MTKLIWLLTLLNKLSKEKWTPVEKAILTSFGLFLLGGLSSLILPPILDSQNPRSVEVDATNIQFSLPPVKGLFVQQQVLTDNTAPSGDFEVITSTIEGEGLVARVDESFPRWWKEQRRETYANLMGAKKVAVKAGCNRIVLNITGTQLNLPVFGKRYPVLLRAKSACNTPKAQ
jgi:hypothetical protein